MTNDPNALADVCTKIYGNKNKTYIGGDGREHPFIDAIADAIGDLSESVIEPFGGSQFVAANQKQVHGLRVITNDYRKASYYCALAIIQNNDIYLDAGDVRSLKTGKLIPGPVTKLHERVLGLRNALEYDRVISNLKRLRGPRSGMIRAIAVWGLIDVLNGCLDKYILRGAHRDSGAAGNEHIRNADLIAAWEHRVLCEHPRFIGGRVPCEAHNLDAVDFMRWKPIGDCLYVDAPYARGDYAADYKALEDICRLSEGERVSDPALRHPKQPPHRFDNRADFLGNLAHLLIASAHIPRWVISINTSSPVSPEEIASIARSMGRSVEIRRYKVPLITNTKRQKPDDNQECLIICKPSEMFGRQVSQIREKIAGLAGKTFEVSHDH